MSVAPASPDADALEPRHRELLDVVAPLAALDRAPCSPGEREAAHRIADLLRDAGCRDVAVDEEPARSPQWPVLTALCLLGAVASFTGRRATRTRTRLLAALAGTAAGAAALDDCANGPQIARRVVRERPTWNVVAEAGDPDADTTLVLLAHHDAAPSGLVFDQRPQKAFWERFPDLVERTDTSVPMWWPVHGAPVLGALATLTGRRGAGAVAVGLGLMSAGFFADIARRPPVPGANDNLSGVAGLVAVARALRREPVTGVRVLLVSCGAEEAFQQGMRAFARRHLTGLPPERTRVLNLETVGSPRLAMLEGEGTALMEDYEPRFRDRVADVAARAGIPLRRNLRASLSTDSVIAHRAGFPVVTLVSINAWKSLSNYHSPEDTPENLDLATVDAAARLAEAVARDLAEHGP